MRWPRRPRPAIGDYNTRWAFAWLPTELDNGYSVWLERYRVIEKYVERTDWELLSHGYVNEYTLCEWKVIHRDFGD